MESIDDIKFRIPGNHTESKLANKYIKDELKYWAIRLLCQITCDLERLPTHKVLGSEPKENMYNLDILPYPISKKELEIVKTSLINFVRSSFNVKFCNICNGTKNLTDMNSTHNTEEHECFYDTLADQ